MFRCPGPYGDRCKRRTPPAAAPKLTKWQQQQQKNYNNSAPADRYFGRAKMSILDEHHVSGFGDRRAPHTTDPAIVNKVALAEDALGASVAKYPRDPQLLCERIFSRRKSIARSGSKRTRIAAGVSQPGSCNRSGPPYFGRVMKRELATGFTERYYALPLPCATPAPTPVPTEQPSDAPSAEPSPPPATPSPSPGPTETALAKGLHVQIIRKPAFRRPPVTVTVTVSITIAVAGTFIDAGPAASPTPESTPR